MFLSQSLDEDLAAIHSGALGCGRSSLPLDSNLPSSFILTRRLLIEFSKSLILAVTDGGFTEELPTQSNACGYEGLSVPAMAGNLAPTLPRRPEVAQFIRHVVTVQAGHVLPRELFQFRRTTTAISDRTAHTRPASRPSRGESSPLSPNDGRDIGRSSRGGCTTHLRRPRRPKRDHGAAIAARYFRLPVTRRWDGGCSRPCCPPDCCWQPWNWQRRAETRGRSAISKHLWALGGCPSGPSRSQSSVRRVPGAIRQTLAEQGHSAISTSPQSFNRQRHLNRLATSISPSASSHRLGWLRRRRTRLLGSTVGNTILITQSRRPQGTASWDTVRHSLLSLAVEGEWTAMLAAHPQWTLAQSKRQASNLPSAPSRSGTNAWRTTSFSHALKLH